LETGNTREKLTKASLCLVHVMSLPPAVVVVNDGAEPEVEAALIQLKDALKM